MPATTSQTTFDRVDLNLSGFRRLRNSPEVVARLRRIVDRIAADAGEGYVGDIEVGGNRASGAVLTASGEAVADNARHNTLVAALGRARA